MDTVLVSKVVNLIIGIGDIIILIMISGVYISYFLEMRKNKKIN